MNIAVADKSPAIQNRSNNANFDTEEVIDLGQYWRTIKRAKWSIMAVTLCCLIIGGLIASSSVPIYRASAKILADPQQPQCQQKRAIHCVCVSILILRNTIRNYKLTKHCRNGCRQTWLS